MSCRHDLANTTCRRCYPGTGTIEPGPEEEHEPNLEGPGAVPRDRTPKPERKPAAPFRDRNAVVEVAEIHWDHSSIKVSLQLSYGSAGSQGAGTHLLTEGLVRGLMEVAGVQKWSDLPGRVVRARASATEGVRAVGHAVEELWVTLGDEPEDDLPY